MDVVTVAIAGAWLFASVAVLAFTRGASRRRTPKPQGELETRVGVLERAQEGLHGDYLKLNQKINKMRYDDRRQVDPPANGAVQGDLSQDPRFKEYFD